MSGSLVSVCSHPRLAVFTALCPSIDAIQIFAMLYDIYRPHLDFQVFSHGLDEAGERFIYLRGPYRHRVAWVHHLRPHSLLPSRLLDTSGQHLNITRNAHPYHYKLDILSFVATTREYRTNIHR